MLIVTFLLLSVGKLLCMEVIIYCSEFGFAVAKGLFCVDIHFERLPKFGLV
jgi:hypothetical protein